MNATNNRFRHASPLLLVGMAILFHGPATAQDPAADELSGDSGPTFEKIDDAPPAGGPAGRDVHEPGDPSVDAKKLEAEKEPEAEAKKLGDANVARLPNDDRPDFRSGDHGSNEASGPALQVLKDADGTARIIVCGLDDAKWIAVIGSGDPSLGDAILLASLPVHAAEKAWESPSFLATDSFYLQAIAIDADGGLTKTEVKKVHDSDPDVAKREPAECYDDRPEYDGPEMRAELTTIHYFDGREPQRAVAVEFDLPAGLRVTHRSTAADACGETVWLMLESTVYGERAAEPRHAETFALSSDSGPVRVMVAREMPNEFGQLGWVWQLAAEFGEGDEPKHDHSAVR